MASMRKSSLAPSLKPGNSEQKTDTKSGSHDATKFRREPVGVRRLLVAFTSSVAALVLFNATHQVDSYVLCSSQKNIYTVDPSKPRVQCISVKGSNIVDIGEYHEVIWSQGYINKALSLLPNWTTHLVGSRVIQVESSSVVVPGLSDSHAHIIENGYMNQLPLIGSKSIQDVVDRIKAYIISHPDLMNDTSQWIEGMGWDQTKWPGAHFPTAADLNKDPLLKNRLISLNRVDGHARWVSPAVLKLLPNLPKQVDGGLIVRDWRGNPTGIFVDNAMSLIPVPPWTEKQLTNFFDMTMESALSYGLTSIHDAGSSPEHIEFFKRRADAGSLPARLYVMGKIDSDDYWGNQIPRLLNYGKHGRLTIRSIKIVADGALGSWGAALLKPYSDNSKTKGLLLHSPENLSKLIHQFWKDDWQTNVHCIGDRANHEVLNIFEDILERQGGNVSEWRPRIEHAQIFAPEDLDRMRRLGVIASVQPTHATSDMWYAENRLGPERIKGAYAYSTLLNASPHNILPLGSDFPVEGVNPLLGFFAAVARLSVEGTSPHGDAGWYPNQRLTREQALKGMTFDAAYASFAEHELGSLSPGKKADFVVFDRNIMEVPVQEILQAKVTATVVDGEVVFGGL